MVQNPLQHPPLNRLQRVPFLLYSTLCELREVRRRPTSVPVLRDIAHAYRVYE